LPYGKSFAAAECISGPSLNKLSLCKLLHSNLQGIYFKVGTPVALSVPRIAAGRSHPKSLVRNPGSAVRAVCGEKNQGDKN
jgi:hypothetical protein